MSFTATRKTAESVIIVKLDFGPRREEVKKGLQTTMPFFNHMLEQLLWRGEFNLEVSVALKDFLLYHVICEDVGITLGQALRAGVEARREAGLRGYGFAFATIDEALARAVLSFEGRASFHFSAAGLAIPLQTENTNSEDLQTFFEGFVQGASCTLHLDLLKGCNGHHIWEALFRAFGEALRYALEPQEQRRGMTAGVAGPVQLTVDVCPAKGWGVQRETDPPE
ncbi:MAG: imidazoleglycerol-phosphate dehydratase [Bacillota bacterium]